MNANDYRRLVSQPSFISQKIFNKNLTVLHKIKEVLTFKQSVYVGICIIDLSRGKILSQRCIIFCRH